MTKLKLETIEDDKPVNRMVKFPGAVYRDLTAYAEVLAHDRPQRVSGTTQRGERVHRQRRHRHLGGHQAMPREPYGRAPGDNGWSGWQNGCRK